jgi:7-cyano-7-deazaguanine synthase in queuosine biosynthesis
MSSFFIRRTGTEEDGCDHVLEVGANLFTGERDFEAAFGSLTSLESDLLLIGSAVLAADRASERGEREDHARGIQLKIPVVNAGRLSNLANHVENILRILSNDGWRIELRQIPGSPESTVPYTAANGRTLLFSGGMDSLAAAVDFGRASEPLQLVSHKTRNQRTDRGQRELVSLLGAKGVNLPHHQFFVSSRDNDSNHFQHDVENSQRTRSFLFLILGALAARRANHSEIVYLAENGQMAIHLPLTEGRIGAFSTHTAHPDFVNAMQSFLSDSLGRQFQITNPYLYKTKAEVIETLVTDFSDCVGVSQSCWRNAHLPSGITHCGLCIPCFVRRIAIEFWIQPDPTVYMDNYWTDGISSRTAEDDARRNMADLCEFIVKMETMSTEEVMSNWPELYSTNLDSVRVIEMYRRFAAEARQVLGAYPQMTALLS